MGLFGLDLARTWYGVYKRRWIVALIFTAVFASTVFFTNRLSPVYKARAAVRIDEPKDMGGLVIPGEGGFGFDINSEVRFIRSPQVMEEVVKRLGLAPEWTTLEQFKNISRTLSGRIRTESIKDSNIVEIIATAPTAEGAAELANAVARAYVDISLKERRSRIRSFRLSLEEQLNTLKANLDGAEEAMAEFNRREGDIAHGKKGLETRLRTLELKLIELSDNYSEEYPTLKVLKEQVEVLREEYREFLDKELELKRLTRDAGHNRRIYEDWAKRVTAIQITEDDKTLYASVADLARPPESPTWPNKVFNIIVGTVVGAIMGATYVFFMENVKTSLDSIEEVENFTNLPVIGIIPYLRLKAEEKKRRLLFYRRKPDKFSRLKERLIINYSSQSPASESYRSLRTNIQSLALEKGAKALLITSTGPNEGKSITAVNLAIIAAQGGHKVLLVDGDLRRPIINKLFGRKKEPGLTEYLTGAVKLEDTLAAVTDILTENGYWEEMLKIPGLDNLKMMPSGRQQLNPAELLNSEEIKTLVRELKKKFDLVLFDSPPVLPIPDASILGSKLDGAILVYQTGVVAKEALCRAKEQLQGADVSVKGIILNSTTREMEAYPPSPYYYKYKYYEGEIEK